MGGHPSAPIVPALFASGEMLDCTGRDFIAAYVAGFETETRIGRGVNLHHYEKGWHPTATLGVFGAAAACCHLIGLDRAKTAQALAIAASLASGIKANFGTMTKPLHVGHTARNGLFAAMLAREGFTANDAALEHKQGFLHVFNGVGNFDAEEILADWGRPYDIVSPVSASNSIRAAAARTRRSMRCWPCAPSTNRPGQGGARRIVDAFAPPCPYRPARSAIRSRREIQRAILLGAGPHRRPHRARTFRGRGVRDPAVRALNAAHPRRAVPANRRGRRAARRRLRITLDDGTRSPRGSKRARARPRQPAPRRALRAKFANCAGRALPPSRVEHLRQALYRLDQAGSLRDVIAAMAAVPRPRDRRTMLEPAMLAVSGVLPRSPAADPVARHHRAALPRLYIRSRFRRRRRASPRGP